MQPPLTSECVQWVHGLGAPSCHETPLKRKHGLDRLITANGTVLMAPSPHSSGRAKRPRAEGMKQL
jgi:hypothetical protein